MTRHGHRPLARLSRLACCSLAALALAGCVSPFSAHAEDVKAAWARKARDAHRKYDKYILGLDWDDPYHQWHDESYASGPLQPR